MAEFSRRQFLSAGVVAVGGGALAAAWPATSSSARPPALDGRELDRGWTFRAADSDTLTGAVLSSGADVPGLDPAVVPGTPLTSMVANGRYPDPLYRHIVTDTVPDTLKDTDYWYRTSFAVPRLRDGQRFWLEFDGVNYLADVWLEGTHVGSMQGAFVRGVFDVTDVVADAGKGPVHLAVRVGKLDYSEGPALPSYTSGVTRGGRNGGPTGVTLENGPTFFCTAGWDWLPTIPDRDLGIWQPVRWSTTGPVRITDLHVDPTVSDDLTRADVTLDLALDSADDDARTAIVTGRIGTTTFRRRVTVPSGSSTIRLTSDDVAALRLDRPRLWWPNGYGEPYLYPLILRVETDGAVSDERVTRFGVRRIEYRVPRTDPDGASVDTLALTVNNQRILVMGGNWGLDEALKRIPRERLYEQVRLHRDANLNVIRNWNGQSSTEDLYAACDEFGILVWQDFFSSTEGPQPVDVPRDVANIRECIVRFRNHPSVLLWCGGNEGPPKQELIDALDALVAELDPKRACLTSSAGDTGANAINGYTSGGPYQWVTPTTHFTLTDGTTWPPFHNEVGSYSIPTLEFVEKMLPKSSWEHPDDYWADRDVNGNGGNGGGAGYIALTAKRYGEIRNLADFARKSQLMNYECIKAIYESRVAHMIGVEDGRPYPPTGVIMWMTNPAQPSFVWQMYSHDLEAHSSYYAVQQACRRVNVVHDARTHDVTVANHTASRVRGTVEATLHDATGRRFARTTWQVDAAPSDHTRVGGLADELAAASGDVAFVRLTLRTDGAEVRNFYWVPKEESDTAFASLDDVPAATITAIATAHERRGGVDVAVRVENTGSAPALMTHLQVYDTRTGRRVLPATFGDNYLNLLAGETDTAHVTVAGVRADRIGVRVDGWKLDQQTSRLRGHGVTLSFNTHALDAFPKTIVFDR